MSTLSVRLPDSLHQQIRLLAQQEGVSINQLIASAVGEKVSSLMTESYLAERAAKGNKADFLSVMKKVPDTEPEEFDKL
ncbi:toxin-antitoxin system HicB family antitoxin [Thiomicrorhabdus indica]|uniref:toxin-antitoxin system HicB family antitoxin n=1 Tax=Thiomicrorhabdus indica TaxID=2267253 RepID=UPI002AA8E5B1|nr:toxin-antitoxin system HicB family antitoxin [Thiomicrorhabdus indica]